jgi:hypothetical protein
VLAGTIVSTCRACCSETEDNAGDASLEQEQAGNSSLEQGHTGVPIRNSSKLGMLVWNKAMQGYELGTGASLGC